MTIDVVGRIGGRVDRPTLPRDPNAADRTATPLELPYDLVFVAVAAALSLAAPLVTASPLARG